MRKNKEVLKVILFGLFLFLSSSVFGEPKRMEELVNSSILESLKTNGFIRKIYSSGNITLQLIPTTEYKTACMENKVEKNPKNYPFVTESLYYISKSEILRESGSTKKNITINDVSVVLRSFSNMKGMEYYSKNRKKTEVLYKEAHTIDGPKTKKKIPDQTSGNADGKTLYILQNDASFGKTVYELKYHQNNSSIYVSFTNQENMGVGPIRAIKPESLKIHIMVTDCGDGFCMYLLTDADCSKFPGMAELMENSLTSRMDAIKNWFVKQF